jgi:hypothetical protein
MSEEEAQDVTAMNYETLQPWISMNASFKQEIPKGLVHDKDPSKGIHGDWWRGSAAFETMNEICGASGWSDRILNTDLIELEGGKGFLATALAEVTVHGIDDEKCPYSVSHEGVGACLALSGRRGLAPSSLRTAILGAATIATKRALRKFGRRTGADLYFDEDESKAMWPTEDDEGEDKPIVTPPPKKEKKKVEQEPFPAPERNAKGEIYILGKQKPADGKVKPPKMVGYLQDKMLEMPKFHGKGNYWKSHLQKWFDPAKGIADLTWEQVAVMLHYGATGNRPAPWYTVKVEAEPDDVDAVAELAGLAQELEIPDGIIKEIVERYFDKNELTGINVATIVKAISDVHAEHGARGIVNKKGEISPKLTTELEKEIVPF